MTSPDQKSRRSYARALRSNSAASVLLAGATTTSLLDLAGHEGTWWRWSLAALFTVCLMASGVTFGRLVNEAMEVDK